MFTLVVHHIGRLENLLGELDFFDGGVKLVELFIKLAMHLNRLFGNVGRFCGGNCLGVLQELQDVHAQLLVVGLLLDLLVQVVGVD